jgi:hypothetical protein
MDLPSSSTSPLVIGVVGVAGDGLGERGLAGAVGPHDGVDLAAVDREGEALDDGFLADADVEVLDFELAHVVMN